MIFYLIGIDYKTVELKKREEASLLRKKFIQFLNSNGLHNARLLSTCNRFEIYDFAKDTNEAFRNLDILKKNFNYFFGNNYTFFGEKEVFKHLLKVGCGLESQLKTEGQILEQLINFRSQKDFPENLKEIVDKAISAAGFIRAKLGPGKKVYSIADLVLEDITAKTAKTNSFKVIVVGTGKLAGLFSAKLMQGAQFYFLAHKNYIKANELAKKAGGKADSLHKIDEIILDANVLISATNSPHYILTAEFFKKVMAERKEVLYVYDLAIPRDIDPKASEVDGLILKNMDDLEPLFEKQNKKIERELEIAQYLVEEKVGGYEVNIDEEDNKNWYAAKQISERAG